MDEFGFYQGRRVLITGHTGFKGAWLSLWLAELGAEVSGYSVDLPTHPNLYETLQLDRDLRHHTGDIRDFDHLQNVIDDEQPEVIFHLAAQPLVRRSRSEPKLTFDVNVGGTVNLLEAVRGTDSVRAVVLVTTDKCYENSGRTQVFREADRLGGHDPYSASKACAEHVAAAYRETFFSARAAIGIATARAGNVIGGGDWAEDRIVPDCIRALMAEEPIRLRHPQAIRPWQHVLEPLAGYLQLANRLFDEPSQYADAWNFGPADAGCCTVRELVERVVEEWGEGVGFIRHARFADRLESACLQLNSEKAITQLGWRPTWNIDQATTETVRWYRAFAQGESPAGLRQLCLEQINVFQTASNAQTEWPRELQEQVIA